MKFKPKILFSLIFIFPLVINSCSDENKKTESPGANENVTKRFSVSDKKIFGIKSGIIEYEITGSQTGSKKLYFDDWGRKQAEFTNSTIKVGKYSKHTNLLKITKGDLQYVINLDSKTGTKRENPVIEKMIELGNQVNFGEFGEQLILIDGGFESGSENISGRKCKIFKFSKMNTTKWVWNWITLKSEIKQGKINIITKAINIKDDVDVSPDIFSIPSDVLITEIDLESLRNREREMPVNK